MTAVLVLHGIDITEAKQSGINTSALKHEIIHFHFTFYELGVCICIIRIA